MKTEGLGKASAMFVPKWTFAVQCGKMMVAFYVKNRSGEDMMIDLLNRQESKE